MTDWHVYLLTLDIESSVARFERGEKVSVTFTVVDNDTDEPVEGAVIRLGGVVGGRLEGTTDAEGNVAFDLTPDRSVVRLRAKAEGFNMPVTTIRVSPGYPVR